MPAFPDHLPTSLTDAPDQTAEYHYDAMGNRDQVVIRDASGAITRVETYGYDAQNRLTSISSSEGTIHYAYDPVTGQLTDTWTNTSGAVDPADASTWMHYSYDSFGRLYQATARRLLATSVTRTTTYRYDKVGNLASVLQPNGVLTSYTYNALNRLDLESVTQGNDTLAVYDYELLPDGNRDYVIETDSLGGQTKIDWTYDADDRLVSEVRDEGNDSLANGGDYTDSYTLDLVGNRLEKDHDAVGSTNDETISSTYNERDQLISSAGDPTGSVAYTYDANGSQETKTQGSVTTTYQWDLQNHLSGIDSDGDGTVEVSYRYDSDGVRVAESANGQTLYYLNDPQNPTGYTKAIEDRSDTNADGTADTAEKGYLLGLQVIGQADASGSHYLLLDGHGSTRAVTDLSGSIVESYDYDVYGVALNFNPNTAKTNWQFGGDGLWDPNSLFTYHLARFRDGARFVSYDSFEAEPTAPASLHKYLYANARPTRTWDASGHEAYADPMGAFMRDADSWFTQNVNIGSALSAGWHGVMELAGQAMAFRALPQVYIPPSDDQAAAEDIIFEFYHDVGPLVRNFGPNAFMTSVMKEAWQLDAPRGKALRQAVAEDFTRIEFVQTNSLGQGWLLSPLSYLWDGTRGVINRLTCGSYGNMSYVGSFNGWIDAQPTPGCGVTLKFHVHNVTSSRSGNCLSHPSREQNWDWEESYGPSEMSILREGPDDDGWFW